MDWFSKISPHETPPSEVNKASVTMLLTQECIPKVTVDLQRVQTACLTGIISTNYTHWYFNNIYIDNAPN